MGDSAFNQTIPIPLDLATGVTGTLPILRGGTGQTTSTLAFNALVPSQTGNAGEYLTTDGTNTSWAPVSGGSGISRGQAVALIANMVI